MTETVALAGYKIPKGLYIGGKWLKGNGDALKTYNPATEEELVTIETASVQDIDVAVAAAREAFETTWGTNMAGSERGRLMFKLADAFEAATEELALIESLNSGKPLDWCKADIGDCCACIRFFAGAADKIRGATIEIEGPSKYASTFKQPVGVVAQVIPWNYPLMMMCWKIAPALATGCAIILKPAEQTPLSALRFAEILGTVGFPAGSFNVVNGVGAVVGEALSRHMDIDKIAFTGSTITGRKIAVAAAQSNLKRVTLELGGKSPNIVFEKADLKEAAKWAAFGIFENQGESCTAGSRILVQESIYDQFIPLLLEAAKAVNIGDPLAKGTFMGAQINKAQFEKTLGYIEKGKANGGKVLIGGVRHGDKGFFVSPTIFGDMTMANPVAQEEIFGPVAAVIKFKDEAEAIQIANDTSYGLACGIHTQDYKQSQRVARRLNAGTTWLNHYVLCDHRIPFGGFKASGWGRELGMEGLDAYLETKAVHHYYPDEPFEWPSKLIASSCH